MGKERMGLKDLLKIGQNINTGVKTEEQTEAFSVVNLSVYDLEAHPRNFYSTTEQKEILDLKDSIELFGGVQQNLIVVKNAPEAQRKYKIIAGHKRNIASEMLVEEGKKKFEYVPCLIKNNLDEIIERILLIHTNSTIHQLSDWEKTEQLRQLKELLGEYKKLHKLPGRLQELLADTLNISASQVARHERIDEKLIDEYKEEYKSGEVRFSTAAEIARLSEEEQRAAYESGVKKLEEVKEIREAKKGGRVEGEEPEQPSQVETKDVETEKPSKVWEDMTPCEQCRSANPQCDDNHCCKTCEETCNGRQECRIDHSPEERQREIDEWNQRAKEYREAKAGREKSKKSEETEAEPALLVTEGPAKPKERARKEEPPEPGVLKIEAVRFTMRILEREIEKCGIEIRYAEEQGKTAKGGLAAAKLEYLGGVLSKVQKDLSDMTGDDMFREE